MRHKKDREARIILSLIFTGLRPGELAKVSKDDNLHLNEGYLVNGSKTAAGKNRIVPVVDFIKPVFVEAALSSDPGAPLFKSPTGDGPLNLNNYRKREFYPCLIKLGIMENPYDEDGNRRNDDPIRFKPYTCRHTFASLSNRSGVKRDTLQKAIGHVVGSDVTDKVYIHQQVSEYSTEFSQLDLLAAVLATAPKQLLF